MDDLENKNVSGGNDDELEKIDLPESPAQEPTDSDSVAAETADSEVLDDKEIIERQLDELVSQLKAKNEEKILKDDVQDWDGLVDDSRQDAEDFILNESSDISEEKIENIEVMEVDEDDDRLCSVCHRRLKMEKDGITYEYCRRCRSELLETKYNWKSVITFILSCVVFVFAVALSAVAIINGLSVSKASAFSESRKMISAGNAYEVLVNSSSSSSYAPVSFEELFKVNTGENTIKQYLKSLYAQGDFQTLKSLIPSYYSDEDLAKSQNADIKAISDTVNGIFNAGSKLSSTINSLPSDPTKEDVQKVIDKIEEYKKDESLDPNLLIYYQYYVSTMLDDDYDLQLKYLGELEKNSPDLKLFYTLGFANVYLSTGDYDKCIEYCDTGLKNNIEDFDSWKIKIRAFTRQKKYDEALALCEEAMDLAKNIYVSSEESDASTPDLTYGYSVYLEEAILYGIKGDMKKAQDASDKAYQGQLTLDSVYINAMLNKKNGNDEAYEEIVSMLEQYNMTIPDICQEYIDGTKTFEDIFVNGKVAWYK